MFKPFSIVKFAMIRWFLGQTYFIKVFLSLFFSQIVLCYFYYEKDCLHNVVHTSHHIKWDINISSSLKLFLKVWIWYSTHQNMQVKQKEGYSCSASLFFCFRTKMYYKKRRIPVCLFDKNCTEDIVKWNILYEES